MRFDDDQGGNLFARLFTYAPSPPAESDASVRTRRRNALEDFCTEAFAWCLIASRPFAAALFDMPAFRQSILSAPFTVDTQLSFTGERQGSDDAERALRGRFDLVLRSQRPPPAVVVVECKVPPEHPVTSQSRSKIIACT